MTQAQEKELLTLIKLCKQRGWSNEEISILVEDTAKNANPHVTKSEVDRFLHAHGLR